MLRRRLTVGGAVVGGKAAGISLVVHAMVVVVGGTATGYIL